jgi:DNA replication protein DnaC
MKQNPINALLSTLAPEKTSENSELLEPDKYSDIELDENELEDALREARKKKYFRQANDTYWQTKVLGEETYQSYTAETLAKELKRTPIGTDANGEFKYFEIDEHNREVVKQLCYYFTNDARFEQYGSLQKGLMLMGTVGVGKSIVMGLLQQNQKQSYRIESTLDIVTKYQLQGTDEKRSGNNVLSAYYANLPISLGGNPFGHRQIGFCFDDLGIEELRAMNYGTPKNCMEEILWKRYTNRLFTSTHVTTNLSTEELRTAYGPRIYDRLKEMFNIITWPKEAVSRRQ